MKTKLLILAACVFTGVGAWAADTTITFTTPESPRFNTTTGYIDWAQVSSRSGSRLISVYGYNSGPAQFVQLYNATNGPAVQILDTAVTPPYVDLSGGMGTGDAIRFTNTDVVATAKIYYLRQFTNAASAQGIKYHLYDTRAHALNAASTTGIVTIANDLQTGFAHLVPKHTFAVAANDNFSCIIQGSGMGFGRGIAVAVSTTAPVFTAGQTNITICATYY